MLRIAECTGQRGLTFFGAYILVESKQPINVKTIIKKISHPGKFIKKLSMGMGRIFKYMVRAGLCGMT